MEKSNYKDVLKKANENIIRSIFRQNTHVTQTDLSRISNLSFPTVSKILDKLEQEGEIVADGLVTTTGGRHSKRYTLNPEYKTVLCISFQNNEFDFFIVNLLGKVISRGHMVSLVSGTLATFEFIVEHQLSDYMQMLGLIIGVRGTVTNGVMTYAYTSPELENINLEEYFKQKYQLPTHVENDMNLAAIGYYANKFEVDKTSVASVKIVEDGLGLSVNIDGLVLRGASGFAGEINFLPLVKDQTYFQLKKNDFHETSSTEMLLRLLLNICVMINPKYIILYDHPYVQKSFNILQQELKKQLPAIAIPEIIHSFDFDLDHHCGLVALAKKQIEDYFSIT